MPKKKDTSTKTQATRLPRDIAEKLDSLAEKYRCTSSDLIRWAAEDLVSGKYLPAHLAK